ncbi:MAG: response regulator [Deltaproteobacteria bacterium]|nr:response regulator [Deltaproteobacteria bacterium]
MPLNILLVDDEDTILFAMREYFQAEGYEVDCAKGLQEAKAALALYRYTVVITDLRLSGVESSEGLTLVEYIRSHCATTRTVMLTAYASAAVETEARRRGVDAFLHKLTPLPEIAHLIRGLLTEQERALLTASTSSRPLADVPTILVIDDQEEALISTRLLLEQEGYRVLTALGGHEALVLFRPGAVQLVIVDYFMPRMTGEHVVQEIRARDSDVQMLLQTGYSGEKPPREMLRLLDIQGYHDKLDGPERLLLWVDVALKAAGQLHRMRTAEQQVQLSRTQLRRLAARLFHVQEIEREDLGRELHDHLGQLLTAAKMDVEWAQRACLATQQELQDRLREAVKSIQTATGVTRTLSASLRPMTLSRLGLTTAIRDYVTDCARRSGMAIQFLNEENTLPTFAKESAINVYRIVQEALNNVIRHAAATEVTVKLWYRHEVCWIAIDDNGKGFVVEHAIQGQGLGLIGMHERAQLIGGTLQISSKSGTGTTLLLTVPLSTTGDTDDYCTVN